MRIFIPFRLMLLGIGLLFCSIGFAQIPTNFYSNSTGKSGAALRSALRDITKTGHVKLPYTSSAFHVWNAYAYTDVRRAPSDSIVWDMYSDKPGGTPNYYY